MSRSLRDPLAVTPPARPPSRRRWLLGTLSALGTAGLHLSRPVRAAARAPRPAVLFVATELGRIGPQGLRAAVDLCLARGAQLLSPAPAGTVIGFVGQPLGIVLAAQVETLSRVCKELSQHLPQWLVKASGQELPARGIAAALGGTRRPAKARLLDARRGKPEERVATVDQIIKQTYHSAAIDEPLPAGVWVTVEAQLGLPKVVLSCPSEGDLVSQLAAWSHTPATWISVETAPSAGQQAAFPFLTSAQLAWHASATLRMAVTLSLSTTEASRLRGQRPELIQVVTLGSDRSGRVRGLLHKTLNATGLSREYVADCGVVSEGVYDIEHVELSHQVIPQPILVRGDDPYAAQCEGCFALETALDELASLLKLDPAQLRERNLGPRTQLREQALACLRVGQVRIDWTRRSALHGQVGAADRPRGLGMALGTLHAPIDSRGTSEGPLVLGTIAHFVEVLCHKTSDGTWTVDVVRYVVAMAAGVVAEEARASAAAHAQQGVRNALRAAMPGSALENTQPAMQGLQAVRWSAFSALPIDVVFVAADPPVAVPRGDELVVVPPEPSGLPLAELTALAGMGAAAALASACYQATGVRLRSLPLGR